MKYTLLKINLLSLIVLLLGVNFLSAQKAVLSGTITEAESGESLPGSHIVIFPSQLGEISDSYGRFRIEVDSLHIDSIYISHIGHHHIVLKWSDLRNHRSLEIEMKKVNTILEEVVIAANSPQSEFNAPIGRITLLPTQILQSPTLLGEKDLFKTLLTKPGFMNPKEGFSGLFVRGGGPGENLYILDDAPIYHANHLFGFLSVFNGQAINHVDVYKGGFPARYGGRLSSILDIRMKEGHMQKWQATGHVGLISSGVTVEGPIVKDKISVMVAGRRTYADLLINSVASPQDKTLVNFYDLNAKFNWKINDRHRVYLSTYAGNDLYGSQTTGVEGKERNAFDWGNRLMSFRWNYRLTDRVFSNLIVGLSQFHFNVGLKRIFEGNTFYLNYLSGIRDYFAKWEVDLGFFPGHEVKTGLQINRHGFNTGALVTVNVSNPLNVNNLKGNIFNTDWAFFAEDRWRIADHLSLHSGLRLFGYQSEGKTPLILEPRISANYQWTDHQVVKVSYSRMSQAVHLLTNSGGALPTDLWVPATSIRPASGSHLFGLGYSYQMKTWPLTIEMETYYKSTHSLVGYKEGASFLALSTGPEPSAYSSLDILSQTTTGNSKAYGVEWNLLWRKPNYTIECSYTWAKARQKLEGVNNEKWFYASHDRRHQLYISGGVHLSPKWYVGGVWTFGSGVPISLISQRLHAWEHNIDNLYAGIDAYVYETSGKYRLPAHHRLDLLVRRYGKRNGYWELGLYNAYMRHNTFYIIETYSSSGGNKASHLSRAIFPIVPSISYHFTINH